MAHLRAAAASVCAVIASAILIPVLIVLLSPLWLPAEFVWFVYCKCYRYPNSSRALAADPVNDIKSDIIWRRIMRLADVTSLEEFVSGWFHGADFHRVRRGNMEDFIAYGFYGKRFKNLDPKEREATFRRVSDVERKFGLEFPPGYEKKIEFMAHAHEPLRYFHKPLIVHMVGETVRYATCATLFSLGFVPGSHQGFRYWIRRPASSAAEARPAAVAGNNNEAAGGDVAGAPARRLARLRMWDSVSELEVERVLDGGDSSPVVFLHGVGLGYAPYIQIIRELMDAMPSRPFLLIEKPHVSLGLTMRGVSTDIVADAVASIMEMQGWPSAAVVAHSYGTFVASRLVQLHPSCVQSVVLIDPVCMFTILPHLLRNFVYASLQTKLILKGPMSAFVEFGRWVLSRDLVVAESFCRHFIWHKECLWAEDLSENSMVVLAAEDHLVPAALVRKALNRAKCTAQIMYHDSHGHGEFLVDNAWRAQMVTKIVKLVNVAARKAAIVAKA